MPDLLRKKIGIVACSGEELAEGTITRLAALKVLEQLRPDDTVTICLPLFLAGGEGDRAFARFYPTIAIDGCEKRCAARATEQFSGKPAASVVVSELVTAHGLAQPEGQRRPNQAGQQLVEITANRVAELVDEFMGRRWSRRAGAFVETIPLSPAPPAQETAQATCSCGSGIPIQQVIINAKPITLVALPLIFEQFRVAGKKPEGGVARELLDIVKIYNEVPPDAEEAYLATLVREYEAFCHQQETTA